jgi:hypothetical protein
LIDFLRLHHPDADGQSSLLKKGEGFLSLFGGKSLGIIDPRQPNPGGQNHGRGHYRTCQRASPGFIQSGHKFKSSGADFLFKGLHASLRVNKRIA